MHSPVPLSQTAVAVTGLELHYGHAKILQGINFSLDRGQTLALLGPSGCGKTTLLRLIAGLLAPTHGSVKINNNLAADAASGLFVPPERRNLGMVFQDYALWPHMSVYGNVAFPLEMRGIAKSERDRRVASALERVGLDGFGERRTSDMSGGQQQRVAIARAIVAEPGLVLFDEPLSNLDRELRENMVAEIGQLVSTLGLTAIYVTHDQSEAFALADRVAVMRGGLIEQIDPPEILVDCPATPHVAEFLRLGCVAGVTRQDGAILLSGTETVLADHSDDVSEEAAHVLIPAKHVTLGGIDGSRIAATVVRSQVRGDGHLATVHFGPSSPPFELQLLSQSRLLAGDRVGLHFMPQHLRWFSPQI
jgi:iron(III) transport system ATP-binding protein